MAFTDDDITATNSLTVANTLTIREGNPANPTELGAVFAQFLISGAVSKGYVNGRFGVGTANPANAFDVAGGATIGGSFAGSQVAPGNGLAVEGAVGIGTAAPLAKLQVVGGAIMPSAGNAAANGILFPPNPGGGAGDQAWIRYFPRTGENTTLELGVGNEATDHLALMASGNVGIGTYEPVNKLDVMGDIALRGKHALRGNDAWLRLNQDLVFTGVHTPGLFAPVSLNVGGAGGYANPGGGNAWISGNVAIGTTTPSRKLHVHGDTGAEIHSSGGEAGFSFTDREAGRLFDNGSAGERWVLFSMNKVARLWTPALGDRMTLNTNGDLQVTGTMTAAGIVNAPAGVNVEGAVPHIERDGSFYRNTDGQVYITVDDNLFIRDWGAASWAAHFATNTGDLSLKGALRSIGLVASAVDTCIDATANAAATGPKVGIRATASGTGQKAAGIFGASTLSATDGSATTAIVATASTASTATVCGIDVDVTGPANSRYGIDCSVTGNAGTFATYGAAVSVNVPATSAAPILGTQGLYSSVTCAANASTFGMNVYAAANGASNEAYGVFCIAAGTSTGTKYGIYSTVLGNSGTRYAGYFQGNVHVAGTLSKANGTFLIDHPLDPRNRVLRHNFVESPEELCIYRGKVKLDHKGEATVKMPSYFVALTKEDDATITLTGLGKKRFFATYEWNDKFDAFTVFGEPDAQVSYLVLATRDDPAVRKLRRPVEEDKTGDEKGKLLFPEAYADASSDGHPANEHLQRMRAFEHEREQERQARREQRRADEDSREQRRREWLASRDTPPRRK